MRGLSQSILTRRSMTVNRAAAIGSCAVARCAVVADSRSYRRRTATRSDWATANRRCRPARLEASCGLHLVCRRLDGGFGAQHRCGVRLERSCVGLCDSVVGLGHTAIGGGDPRIGMSDGRDPDGYEQARSPIARARNSAFIHCSQRYSTGRLQLSFGLVGNGAKSLPNIQVTGVASEKPLEILLGASMLTARLVGQGTVIADHHEQVGVAARLSKRVAE
jgi:hypothetical protein